MSHKLDLEFVPTPFFSYSKLGMLALIISLVVVVFTWQTFQVKRVEHLGLETKLNQLNQQRQKKIPVKQVVTVIPLEKIKQLQETVSALTTPWNELFEAIERADSKDIALLNLEPNSQKQQVVITGEAKNLQVALEYIEQLKKQPMLAQVFLQKHSINESNTSKPVSFTVFAKWKMI